METLTTILVIFQALGAILGAGSAVWGELSYSKAMRDGKVDRAEHKHLEAIHRGLRFGMTTVLLSSFGLVVAAYVNEATPQPGMTASYWLLMIFAFIIIGATWGMARKTVAFTRGSMIAFAAWWFLAYLTLGMLPIASLQAGFAAFIAALVLFAIVLYASRVVGAPRRRR